MNKLFAIALILVVTIIWCWFLDSMSTDCTAKGGTFFVREFKCIDVREIK